jgi:hypothetical protein
LLTLSLHWIFVCKSDPFTAFSHDFLSQKLFYACSEHQKFRSWKRKQIELQHLVYITMLNVRLDGLSSQRNERHVQLLASWRGTTQAAPGMSSLPISKTLEKVSKE